MKKRNSLIALTLVMALGLVGCGKSAPNNAANANEGNNATTEAAASDLKVGFVTDEGGINDQSFNQGVWEGLEKAQKDFGVSVEYLESKDANAYKPNLETLLDNEDDLIVGAGFKMGDAISEEAKANPDVKYAIVDVAPEDAPDNLLGIMFKQEEPSFLVGYIAGLTTETDKVGFVGGQESTIIWGFEYGYKAGVDYAAKELGKEIETKSQYIGGFSDVQKAKAIATQMYQQGCDVVFHAAGGGGDGVIEAAKEQGKWAIGVDRDQYEMAPENVLTSAMKNANIAVHNLVKDLAEGKEFEGGTTISLGLKDEGAVGIAPTSDKNVKKEILDKMPEIEKKIVEEEIKVPYDKESYEEYKANL